MSNDHLEPREQETQATDCDVVVIFQQRLETQKAWSCVNARDCLVEGDFLPAVSESELFGIAPTWSVNAPGPALTPGIWPSRPLPNGRGRPLPDQLGGLQGGPRGVSAPAPAAEPSLAGLSGPTTRERQWTSPFSTPPSIKML